MDLTAILAAANSAVPTQNPSLWASAVAFAAHAVDVINGFTGNFGWTMLILAVIVRILVLPLTNKQFHSMKEMQAIAPYMKRLQQKYKDNRAKLQQEMMALYREHSINPFGGCLPLLLQYPIAIPIYYAIRLKDAQFKDAHWLWIGSHLSHQLPQYLATSLLQPDKILLLLYALSMYVSIRITPTATPDPQQQQMMKTQSFIMPVMIFFLLKSLPSALLLYWLGFTVLSMAQQWYVMRKPSRIPPVPQDTPATLAGYPLNCPSCNALLVVAKGSKCEACGSKVKKVAPAADGLVSARAGNPRGADSGAGTKDKK